MANLQQPLGASVPESWPGWQQALCLPSDERTRGGFTAPRGHLSDNPRVEEALQGFLLFGPPAFLLLGAPVKIAHLYGAKLVTVPNYRGVMKILVALALLAQQLAAVALEVNQTTPAPLLAAQLLSAVASAVVCVLSFLEHGRSVAPSTVLTVYLVFAAFSDGVQVGLLYVARNLCSPSALAIVISITRLLLLLLESEVKTSILREQYQHLAPEETAGFFSSAFFWWVNPFIALGNAKILSLDDMPRMASYLDAMKWRDAMQRAWDTRKKPEHRFTLLVAQFRCLWRHNLGAVVPRLLFTILRYCQPLLISRAIAYVVNTDLSPLENRNEAFRLILSTFVIYTGMAMFKGIYDMRLSRITAMTRMAMVGLVHNRCLTIKDGVFDDAAAVTLMSNDAEQITWSADLLHEMWSQVLELCLGMYLLADELGWVSIVPLLIVVFTAQGSKFVTEHIAGRQKAFSMATQTRISTTKAILDSMKNIKMMGLVDKMEAKIQAARDHELKMFVNFNWLVVAFNGSATILTTLSPAVTLIIYAIQAQIRGAAAIDVNTAFTSMAIIGMVTYPANVILVILPNAASFIAAFDRLQKYLLSPDREDKREYIDKKYTNGSNGHLNGHGESEPSSTTPAPTDVVDDQLAMALDDATIRPAATADPALKNITTTMKKGYLVVCSGAVGTGKTTLAKALLGDLPADTGAIKTAFGSIAYCSQTAWLINGTIKDIIRGPPGDKGEVDDAWYARVLHACDLDEDLDQLPDGDQTVVGSRGITLSGGQKQRVALARAVYAHRDFIILDDVLSALDATTERHIVESLIGPEGLFKELGTTVLLITHATQHLPLADHIIILGEDGMIAEQGSWDDLRADAGYISKVVLKEKIDDKDGPREMTKTRDKIQTPTAKKPDINLQDLSRKTGDMSLYSYYFKAIGTTNVLTLLVSVSSYAVFLALAPYWLGRWAESHGEYMWYYSGIYFLLNTGAFLAVMTTIANVFLQIAPRSGNTLHARILRTVMGAPQSFFATTETGTTLNRFSSDTQMIDRRLPIGLLHVSQCFFRLLSQCVLLGIVQPLTTVSLPFTLAVVWVIQKVYLATSRQLRFLDLETKALVNASFLETLEGVATIRAFGWQKAFINDNVRKLDLSLRPSYMMMVIQRWLNVVLDLTVLGLAMLVMSLAVGLKGTTTGGQIGIALNVVLQANMYLLRLVEAWTALETSLGAIARLRTFETDVPPEDPPGATPTLPPPPAWPTAGALSFTHLSASYAPPTLALRDITASIPAGARVGVCGRTGSGKSSLLLSLLRLIEIESGSIRIDGLDVAALPRNAVRARLITVPQDPMLVLTDTVRQNLDIGDSAAADADIVGVLERVRLWGVLQARGGGAEVVERQARELEAAMGLRDREGEGSSSSSGGGAVGREGGGPDGKAPEPAAASLDVMMKALPLSQGQQQLFSLARAMIMRQTRGKVVLLDEATSNVDGKTDRLVQRLVREEFKDHTIITVAHRLDTIMDSDVVLVLDAGKLVETGSPAELAQKEGGVFRAMYGNK